MTTITTISDGTQIAVSNEIINDNFTNLNNDKVETSAISTDNTLGGASPSDSKISTEKAVKEYVDATASPVGKSWNEYAESNTGTDSYAITVPGVTALVTGQTFKFKADVANTGACTLNVNGLGAKTIKKDVSSDLLDGEIAAGQHVVVVYDGTNMQKVSPSASASASAPVVNVYTTPGSGTWTKPAGLKFLLARLQGPGGATTSTSSGAIGPAQGGGYVEKMYAASDLSATESYVVGVRPAPSGNALSTEGTNTTFKGLVAGRGQSFAYTGSSGTGTGEATGGDLNIAGGYGFTTETNEGIGGSSHLGFGGSTGNGGQGYGGGAGRGNFGGASGAGGPAIIILTEYY